MFTGNREAFDRDQKKKKKNPNTSASPSSGSAVPEKPSSIYPKDLAVFGDSSDEE